MPPRGHLSRRTTGPPAGQGGGPSRGAHTSHPSSSPPLPALGFPAPAGKALQVPKPGAGPKGKKPGPRSPVTGGGEGPGRRDSSAPRGLWGSRGVASLGQVSPETSGVRPYCANPGSPHAPEGGWEAAAVRVSGPRRARAPSPSLSGGSRGLSDGGRLGRQGVKRFHRRGDVERSAGRRQPGGGSRMTGVSVT